MKKSLISFFDSIAKDWDQNEVKSTPERVKSILSKLPIEQTMSVLDLGTGTGVLLPYLAKIVGQSGNIVAVDASGEMLKIARRKFDNLANVKFVQLDFEEEDITGRFDVIMLYCVYPHLQQSEATLNKLIKTNLKKDGSIIIAFPSDEIFINNIHREKKADGSDLPPAQILAEQLCSRGFKAEVVAATTDEYIVRIRG